MRPETLKAFNQLVSVLAGRDLAIKTNDLADDPEARITQCIAGAAQEVTNGAMSGDQKVLKQGQRKLESLSSLKALLDEIV